MLGEAPRKLAMVLPAMRAGGRMDFWYAAGPHVFETIEVNMPSGRIRWFDAKKGYGFIAGDAPDRIAAGSEEPEKRRESRVFGDRG